MKTRLKSDLKYLADTVKALQEAEERHAKGGPNLPGLELEFLRDDVKEAMVEVSRRVMEAYLGQPRQPGPDTFPASRPTTPELMTCPDCDVVGGCACSEDDEMEAQRQAQDWDEERRYLHDLMIREPAS